MKTIFVVIFLIHCSHQYVIEHADKSGTYTYVDDYSDGNWKISSNVPLSSKSKFIRNENGDEVTFKQPETNIQSDDQIVFSELASENQGLRRKFKYYTSKGTVREEVVADNGGSSYVSGKTSYIGDDGIRYIFSYFADSNGYQPKVLFGKNVIIAEGEKTPTVAFSSPIHRKPPKDRKGAGGDSLLCSLIGGGCI